MPNKTRTAPSRPARDPDGPVAAAKVEWGVGPVAQAVNDAVTAADWITPADAAAVALALRLAADVDRCSPDDATQMAALSRTLLNCLAAIGLTVAGRVQADTPPPQQENPLDALRARAAGRLADATSVDTATVRPIKGR
jgi:hypothetical protein